MFEMLPVQARILNIHFDVRISGSTLFTHSPLSLIGGAFVQLCPMHVKHIAVQCIPAMRQEHRFLHPVLHPHDIRSSMDWGATGLSV